ncbi:uncharacterized protein ACIBXB_017056 [Morphnus guianensis]
MSPPTHHTAQPGSSWQPLQQVRTITSAERTKHRPFSASAANFSSPDLHTSRHLSGKKSPLKPKPMRGLDDGKRGGLSTHAVQTLQQAALSQAWLPPQPPDKRGFPLDLLFKNRPKTGIQRFQINKLEPLAGGRCPRLLRSPGCPHSGAAAASMSDRSIYLLAALSYFLV